MAGMWLRDYIRSHQQCNTYQRDSPCYPTRLLHLAGSHGNRDYVGLIRTAKNFPDGPYVTLSYRWGNYKPLQLTQSMASNPNHRFSTGDYAADAVDSTKGLFRHRPPLPLGRQHVKANVKGIEPGFEFVDCLVTDCLLLSRNLANSPLNSRGWVHQAGYPLRISACYLRKVRRN